jgi:hypothetical protein
MEETGSAHFQKTPMRFAIRLAFAAPDCFQRETSGPATPVALHPVEGRALGYAGVAVYPRDIVVGEAEGAVCYSWPARRLGGCGPANLGTRNWRINNDEPARCFEYEIA